MSWLLDVNWLSLNNNNTLILIELHTLTGFETNYMQMLLSWALPIVFAKCWLVNSGIANAMCMLKRSVSYLDQQNTCREKENLTFTFQLQLCSQPIL